MPASEISFVLPIVETGLGIPQTLIKAYDMQEATLVTNIGAALWAGLGNAGLIGNVIRALHQKSDVYLARIQIRRFKCVRDSPDGVDHIFYLVARATSSFISCLEGTVVSSSLDEGFQSFHFSKVSFISRIRSLKVLPLYSLEAYPLS